MRVRLLKTHGNMRAGTEYVPAWDSQARELIRRGIAVEVVRGAPVAGPGPEAAGEAEPTAAEATAGQPAEKPKAPKLKPAKKPKPPKPKK